MQILLFPLLISSMLLSTNVPETPVYLTEKLIEINIEINSLQKQLSELEKKVNDNLHQEMREELKSQSLMRSYEWEGFVNQLEAAEAHEEKAKQEEKTINGIKARLLSLAEQIRILLPNQ